MLAKAGSQMVVNNLKQLDHGLLNTETVFIQNKWAEWTERLKSIIPSKHVITKHVFDNINGKNKTLDRTETHHTNSILVQKYNLAENLSKVSLDADYNFEQKNHWSYKSSTPVLPNIYLKRGSAKRLKYTPVKKREECIKSSFYSLVWAYARITNRETKGSFVEWILRTCLKTRLRSNHRWVLNTLTFFTNRNQSCCSRDQKNAGYHDRT